MVNGRYLIARVEVWMVSRLSTWRNMSTTLILCLLELWIFSPGVAAHGHITWPPSRHNGSLAEAGRCDQGECLWFSQPTSIPGLPTLPHRMRTFNVDVRTGEDGDWSAANPWRAPGTAAVLGSGCGLGGGNPIPLPNGGASAFQGMDGADLPSSSTPPISWAKGSAQKVAPQPQPS